MAEEALFRLRVRYCKQGRLRYLSHLEVIHALERLVLRAGLPYAITQGFSPRMKVAFGPALPVGVASTDEWLDLVMTEYVFPEAALSALQAVAVDLLMPSDAAYVPMKGESLSSGLTLSTYDVEIEGSRDADADARALMRSFDAILLEGKIEYLRSGKPKTVELDGKFADVLRVVSTSPLRLSVTTRSSNEGALRPDVLMGEVLRRRAMILTAEREGALADAPSVVSSDICDLRARICRSAQYFESGDGTWARPI